MTPLLIFIANFFIFILCMIGTVGSFFEKRWNWFLLMLLCVVISAACVSAELYQWLGPAPPNELPLIIRQPTTPL